MELTELPRVLVIHLGRFTEHMASDANGKLEASYTKDPRHVAYPATLDMTRYVRGGVPRYCQYVLASVVQHDGPTMKGGHYVAYVRHGSSWWRCSDGSVSTETLAAVEAAEAYLLFYERADL
jgi:ubiquitin C-terminal hydrolase